jgi:hypothetical protein
MEEEEKEEEEEEEEEEGEVGGTGLEKKAWLQQPLHLEEEEDEDGDMDVDVDVDVGGDAGLQHRSPARPGTAHSPAHSPPMQPHPQGMNHPHEVPETSHHGIDGEVRNTCQMPPLPPSPPEVGSSNIMDVDQANCKPSNVPADLMGSAEFTMAAGRRHGQRDSPWEPTSDTASLRENNQSKMLASQISSQHPSNTLAHPDSENSMDVNEVRPGGSGRSDKTQMDQDTMDIDAANNVVPGEPAETSNTGKPVLRRSSHDRNPTSDDKTRIPAPTPSQKRSKKGSTNHNRLKPKEKLVTVMEETEGGVCEAILVDITIDELEADMVSTLNSCTCSGDGYSCERWRPHESILGKLLRNRYGI